VIGPWVHGGWARYDGQQLGHVRFDSKTGEYFRTQLQFPFFEQHLKGVKPAKAIAEVNVFETGSNVWRQYTAWPPVQAKARTLYFAPGGKLSWTQPASGADYDEYVSDPKKPVPYIGYASTGVPQEYMVSDQRFAATRPGRAGLPVRGAGRRRHHRRPGHAQAVRLDHRHRCRLGGQADRRVSGRVSVG
jgi:predicted acyl esterase